jgi:hypothetical protein
LPIVYVYVLKLARYSVMESQRLQRCQEGRVRISAMSLRLQTVSALIAAAFLQPACATSTMTSKCTASGSLGALPGMDAQAICARFEADLAASLGDTPVPQGLMIALTVHKRGAIDAQLSLAWESASGPYPAISVEVTDRSLQPDDIAQLARTAAQVLAQQPSD